MSRRKGEPRSSSWCSLRALGPVRRCAVILRGGMRCAWCGVALAQPGTEIDHVVPRSKGGGDELTNLVPTCSPCNLVRKDGALSDRLEELGVDPAEAHERVDVQRWREVDRIAGRALALGWYPWLLEREERNRAKQHERDASRSRNRARPRSCGCGKSGPHRRECSGLDTSFNIETFTGDGL